MLELDILYQFNNKYAPYAGTSITSLLTNNRHFDRLTIHILDDSLDPIDNENRNKFMKLASKYKREIIIYDTMPLIDLMRSTGIPKYRGSYSTNMKMFFSHILQGDIDRLLYIDSDTIVPGKLDYLADLDMKNYPLAMALDSVVSHHKEEIGLPPEAAYYNAGIILFNVKQWEHCNCTERIIEHVKSVRAHYPAPDQDLMNIVLQKEIFRLDLRFNLQPLHLIYKPELYLKVYKRRVYYTAQEILDAVSHPVIYHCFRYLGDFPWNYGNFHPCDAIWTYYMEQSLWNNYAKKKASVSMAIRLEKQMYRFVPRPVFIRVFRFAHMLFLARAEKKSLENQVDKAM